MNMKVHTIYHSSKWEKAKYPSTVAWINKTEQFYNGKLHGNENEITASYIYTDDSHKYLIK